MSDSDIKHRNYIFYIVKEKIIERYKDDDVADIQDTINYLRNNDLEIFINVLEYKKPLRILHLKCLMMRRRNYTIQNGWERKSI